MPRFYKGTHRYTDDNIEHKTITFQSLSRYVKNKTFIKPDFQGSLDESRVESMVKCYLKNPANFQYKNRIIIADVNGKLYIIDGQHRVEMIIRLCEKTQKYTRKQIEIVYYPLRNDKEAMVLFNEINIDSHKNKFFITQDLFGQMTISGFREKLKKKFKHLFNRKHNENSNIKCIEHFSNDLYKAGFLKNKTTDEAFDKLIELNDTFFNKLYKPCIENNVLDDKLYKVEIKSILDNGVCFVTKKNNFMEYIKNQTIKPRHTWKKGKKRITKSLKNKVWYNEFNYETSGKCPIAHCNNTIYKIDFEAGHIISELNNGPTELSNLRPICKYCNRQMGSKNWNEWDEC